MTSGSATPPCDRHITGRGVCGATADVQRYLTGWRCPACTPSAVQGNPEAAGQYCAPARCYCGRPECPAYITYALRDRYAEHTSAYAAVDARAIASGRRRSTSDDYATARATVTAQRARDARLRRTPT